MKNKIKYMVGSIQTLFDEGGYSGFFITNVVFSYKVENTKFRM